MKIRCVQSISDGPNKGIYVQTEAVQLTMLLQLTDRKVGGGMALIGTRCYVVSMSSFGFV